MGEIFDPMEGYPKLSIVNPGQPGPSRFESPSSGISNKYVKLDPKIVEAAKKTPEQSKNNKKPAAPALSEKEKAHKERLVRIEKARATGIYDNQYLQDLVDEEEYARKGRTVAQVAAKKAEGDSSSPQASSSTASSGTPQSTAPTPEARPEYSRTSQVAFIGYLNRAAQETDDPIVKNALESMAAQKTQELGTQEIQDRYGAAGAAMYLAAGKPYDPTSNPGGYDSRGMVAPGPAADVAKRLTLEQMQKDAMEVARLRQIYGQGAGALEFLRPNSTSYNAFAALTPSQQLAAIQAANSYGKTINQNTYNSAGNMTELYRKAGFKPNEIPNVDPARFAPGYKWQPPQAPPPTPAPPPAQTMQDPFTSVPIVPGTLPPTPYPAYPPTMYPVDPTQNNFRVNPYPHYMPQP